jgi:ribosome biogenesis protein SSF1/2
MGRRKKKRTHVPVTTQQLAAAGEEEKAPRSLVLRKGRTTPEVATLVSELRRLMGPETASRLKERRTNRMKDYAAVAGHLGLTHILSLSQSPASLSLRLARFPRGPTLTFKVERYCLQAHVRATQKRPYESLSAYQTAPLVVLNNFGDAASPPFVKLMKITFQNMFPPLNVNTVRLTDCRRVVLFDYDPETRLVEQRHFAIRAAPSQVNRSVKRLIQTRIPSLGDMTDISEFILGSGAGGGAGGSGAGAAAAATAWSGSGAVSDSEVEDEAAQVVLPDKFRGRGNLKAQKSAIRLSELGPRLSLRLMKVERGFLEGDVIYHDYIKKAPEEVRALEAKAKATKALKKRRREEQEGNVARKKQKEEERKQRREEKAKARAAAREEAAAAGGGDEGGEDEGGYGTESESGSGSESEGEEE